MKNLLTILILCFPVYIIGQQAKIINHRLVAPKGVVIINNDIIPIIPPDTIKVLNCGEVFECGVIFGCETSYVDVESLDFIDDYFKHEKELVV